MGHDHHRCECEHERVRFCKKCNVCHCLDCKQEWSFTPCQRSHGWTYTYPWYQSVGYLSASAGGGIAINATASSAMEDAQDVAAATTALADPRRLPYTSASCDHLGGLT